MHYKVKKRSGQAGWALLAYQSLGNIQYVQKKDWPPGLRPEMSLEDARTYVKTLNSQGRISTEEGQRQRALRRANWRHDVKHALLPEAAVLMFEPLFFGKASRKTLQKRQNVWDVAQRFLVDTSLHPETWLFARETVYDWFIKRGYSVDYTKRVVACLNLYGYVYCRHVGKPFTPIQRPQQEEQVAMHVAQKKHVRTDLLGLADLTALRNKLPPEQHRWTYVGWWFMLRPQEVDLLCVNPGADVASIGKPTWWVERSGSDVTLVIYQPKLKKVMPAERYKRIPVKHPEQRRALKMVDQGLQRPSRYRRLRTFPKGVTLYGCRHGGANYMAEHWDRQTVSEWLGHKSIVTTERFYLRIGRTVRAVRKAA